MLAVLAAAFSPTRAALVVDVEPFDAAEEDDLTVEELFDLAADEVLEEPFDATELLLDVTLSSFSKFGIAYPFRV